jgi:hypothetical protein
MEETLRFQKNADKIRNRIIIPKFYIDKFGRNFIVDVNMKNGEITIRPIRKGE